ncbi:MAG: hypothetical protein J5958_05040 [Clostridia bacterium]|nr:hypothetical protein [Clostridia bacterium]
MHPTAKRRGVALLLILAMLTVLVTALAPFVSSAEPAEFKDFGYQTPNDYDMLDATTTLRFVFQVPASKIAGYTDVGFVFSKSANTDGALRIGEANVARTDPSHAAVYSSITADGKTYNADANGYWVAVKLVNIPQSYFDGSIYVRGFVTDGEGPRYSDVQEISVWQANSFEYLTKWDAATWHKQPYCYRKTGGSYTSTFGVIKSVANTRKGGKCFYPDPSNGGQGNDLLLEFSFLYNSTQANIDAAASENLAVTYIEDFNLFNINLKTGKITARIRTNSDTPKGDDSYVFPTDPSARTVDVGEYGWHRFGVRIHQTAENNAGEVDYTITATAYLDGVKIFEIDKTTWVLNAYSNEEKYVRDGRLFLVEYDGEGNPTYSNPDDGLSKDYINQIWIMNEDFWDNNAKMYLILQDVSVTCGRDFVQQVVPVEDPVSRTYKTASYTRDATTYQESFTAPVYYALPLSNPLVFNGHDAKAPEEWREGNNTNFMAPKKTLKALATEKGSFYPTDGNPEGNDLLVEFSILWNDTLHADSGKWANLGAFYGTPYSGTYKNDSVNTSWLYFDDGQIELNDGTDSGGIIKFPNPFSDYENLTGEGWHRIGIRYHQTAEAVGANNVAYTLTYTIYVDGVKINEVQTAPVRFVENHHLLYTATNDGGDLEYSDNEDATRKFSWLFISEFFGSSNDKYLVLADFYVTSGHDFVQKVEHVSPVAAPFDLGDYDPAVVHYQLVTP